MSIVFASRSSYIQLPTIAYPLTCIECILSTTITGRSGASYSVADAFYTIILLKYILITIRR